MYYDLLAQMKNAIRARKEKFTVPFSKMDHAVLTTLVQAGYLKSAEKEALGRRNVIVVRFPGKGKTGMSDFKIVSKPSRHFYADYRSLHPVKQGHGVAVLSTSKGIMTDRAARKAKVGGEYLFEIW
jgi:small subunit ribosomal protein S8